MRANAAAWARASARRRPEATRRLADRAGRARAWGTSDRLRNLLEVEEPTSIELPAAVHARRSSLRMFPCDGRDAIVELLSAGWHEFERPMPDAFAAVVRHLGGHVLDVGANSGFYALLAAAAHDRCRVTAFEPFPEAAELLRRNLALNHLAGRVTVVEAAIADEAGEAQLFIPAVGHGRLETSCSLNPTFKEDLEGSLVVPVTTIDAHLASRCRRRPTVIKIDVESLEHKVLAGASRCLRDDRPHVFFEVVHQDVIDPIERLRAEQGYVDIRLGTGGLVVDEPVGYQQDAWNHLLVPREQIRSTLDVLLAAGLAPAG